MMVEQALKQGRQLVFTVGMEVEAQGYLASCLSSMFQRLGCVVDNRRHV